jgi:hypothetical protein
MITVSELRLMGFRPYENNWFGDEGNFLRIYLVPGSSMFVFYEWYREAGLKQVFRSEVKSMIHLERILDRIFENA